MCRLALVILLLVSPSLARCAYAQTPTPDQIRLKVRQALKDAVRERQRLYDGPAIRGEARLQDANIINKATPTFGYWYDRHVAALVSELDPRVHPSTCSLYLDAVVAESEDDDPARRGLACEVLEHVFCVKAIEALGRRLGDRSLPVRRLWGGHPGPYDRWATKWVEEDVGEIAHNALSRILPPYSAGAACRSVEEFEVWWREVQPITENVWFWDSKWQLAKWKLKPTGFSNTFILGGAYESRPGAQPRLDSSYLDDVSDLSDAVQLRILLVSEERSAVFDCYRPAFVDFVKSRHLEEQFLCLAEEPDVLSSFCRVAPYVLTADHDTRLALISENYTRAGFDTSELTVLRTKLCPQNAHVLLSDALDREPRDVRLATLLITECGTIRPDVVKECFRAPRNGSRGNLLWALQTAAKEGVYIPPSLIMQLAESLSLRPPRRPGDTYALLRKPTNMPRAFRDFGELISEAGSLMSLVSLAEFIQGKELTSGQERLDLQALQRRGSGKRQPYSSEQLWSYGNRLSYTCERLRQRLVWSLRHSTCFCSELADGNVTQSSGPPESITATVRRPHLYGIQ